MTVNWAKIKFFVMDSIIWIASHWQIAAVVAGFILVALIFGWIQSCNANRTEKKIDEYKTNITTDKVISNIAANEVKNAEQNTNNATNDFNNSVRTDSNKYSGANAGDKFCRRYPNDSSCAEWREQQRRLQSAPR